MLGTSQQSDTLRLSSRLLLPEPDAPAAREALTKRTFLRLVLPVLLVYYGTAILVLLPRTYALRMGLLPISLWLTYRACTKIDVTLAYNEPRLNHINQYLIITWMGLSMRMIDWSLQRSPLRRFQVDTETNTNRQTGSLVPGEQQKRDLLRDSLDLAVNQRGIGWNWSRGTYIPPNPWNHTRSKTAFIVSALGRSLVHFIYLDCIQVIYPSLNSPDGSSLFDPTVPVLERYFKACAITVGTAFTIYHGAQEWYHIASSIGVLVFRQSPSQWPPLFDEPWRATSLADFWGRRWHQLSRRVFIVIGAKPLRKIFGHVGGVMGAFFVSGLLHDWPIRCMGKGGDFWAVAGYFLMNGVGIIVEGLWCKWTQRRVGGWPGWLWTMAWVAGWGTMLVDAWVRRGLIASLMIPERWRPSRFLLAWI